MAGQPAGDEIRLGSFLRNTDRQHPRTVILDHLKI